MQPKQFVRDATGLVREYGALDVLLFASAMVFALVFTTVQFAWFYGNTGGANLPLSLVFASIPFIFLMVAYWAIGVAMPRTGNDYVWVGRIFHPSIGFAWALLYMFVVFFVAYVGEIAGFSYAFSIAMTTLGLTANSPGLTDLGNFLGGSVGTFELGILFTIVFGVFSMFGARFIKGLMYTSWAIAIVGMLLMWYILASINPTTFASNWDNLLAPSLGNGATYQALQTGGESGGFTAAPFGFASIVGALPLALLFLYGGNYANAFVGEIKDVRKSIPIALFLSLLFGVIYWTITSTLTLNAVGANWMYAVGYAWDNGLKSYALPFPPSQPLILAVAAYPNIGLIYAMFFTYIVGSLAPLFAYFWIPSKYFFAWSFDRVIPSKFADVNERFHTPYLSIIAIMVLGILLSAVYLFLGWSTSFTIGTVIWGISYIIPGLALAAFPFVKKDIFAQAPSFVRAKIGSIPVMSIVGVVTAISFIGAGYLGYITPAACGCSSATIVPVFGLALPVGVIAIGFIIYYASWAYHKSRGLDISKVLRSIPPE